MDFLFSWLLEDPTPDPSLEDDLTMDMARLILDGAEEMAEIESQVTF